MTATFAGEQFDSRSRQSSTGLQYLRARYYDPSIGRFLTADPLTGAATQPQTLNRYAYALNNPTNRVDPSGLASEGPGGGVASEGGGPTQSNLLSDWLLGQNCAGAVSGAAFWILITAILLGSPGVGFAVAPVSIRAAGVSTSLAILNIIQIFRYCDRVGQGST